MVWLVVLEEKATFTQSAPPVAQLKLPVLALLDVPRPHWSVITTVITQ